MQYIRPQIKGEKTDINEPLAENNVENDVETEKETEKRDLSLPVPILPSFLTDEDSQSDLAHFISYFSQIKSFKMTTVYNNARYLKTWRNLLAKKELNEDNIVKILNNTQQGIFNLFNAFKNYADYRKYWGDIRFYQIYEKIKDIKKVKESQKRHSVKEKNISVEYITSFFNISYVLCVNNDYRGIWMALLMYGFNGAEVNKVETEKISLGNKKFKYEVSIERKRGLRKREIPEWLYKAIENSDKKKYVDRHLVNKRIKEYGTSVSLLYNTLNLDYFSESELYQIINSTNHNYGKSNN